MMRIAIAATLISMMMMLACTGESTVEQPGEPDGASSPEDADPVDADPVDAPPGTDADPGDASSPEDTDASVDASKDSAGDAADSGDSGDAGPGPLGGVASSPSDAYPPTGQVTTAQWWVNGDTGSDTNSGASRSEPFATLGRALDVVSDGERIIVEGTLSPSGRISLAGDYATGVEIFNYASERWTLDFSNLSDTKAVNVTGSGYHLKGFEIRDVPAHRGMDVSGEHCTFEDFVIHRVNAGDTGTGIESYGGSFNTYQDGLIYHLGDGSTVHTNTGDCMALTGSASSLDAYSHDNYVVRVMCINGPDDGFDIYRGYDNYFIDSVAKGAGSYWNGNPASPGGDGFGFKMGGDDGSGANHFIGSIAVGNRNDGWHHNTATVACTIVRSTAVGNGRWGFDVGGDSSPAHVVEDSIAFENNDGPFYRNRSQMVNNSWDLGISNPQFYGPDQGDFSLASSSAARGAGQNGDHLGASHAALELLLSHWDLE